MKAEARALSPVLPDRDPKDAKLANTSVTIPEWIRDWVNAKAQEKGYSRSELLTELLKFGIAHVEATESKAGAGMFEALVQAQQALADAMTAYEREKKRK